MKPKSIGTTFFTILIILVSFTEANLSSAPPKPKVRTPVYFPALPTGFSENFGVKVTKSGDSRGRLKSRARNNNSPPISSPKPTTTTEKLPLAQESHVASNSVTDPPGPSYLTESPYYHDPPSALNSGKGDSRHHSDVVFEKHGDIFEDREGEVTGVYLQSVSSYKPQFIEDRIVLDLLLNPALMHYIPIDSGESIHEISTEKSATSIVPEKHGAPVISSTVYKRPITTPTTPTTTTPTTTTEKVTEATSTTPSSRYRRPTEAPAPVSERYRAPSPGSPRLRYKPPITRPPRLNRPSQKRGRRPDSNISLRPAYKPIPPIVVKSKGLPPKTVPNPVVTRISKPVVKPPYETPTTKTTSTPIPKPARRRTTTTTVRTPSRSSRHRRPSTKKATSLREPSSRRTFGEREQRVKTVEIYRPPSTKSPLKIFEESLLDYGFDFNRASGSAPRRQYRPPSVTDAPVEVAPVYHTSTKSYRAPSSLYQVRSSAEKVVTAPSQPDFIQADPNIYIPNEYDAKAIPGEAGIDYPVYATIPDTKFSCAEQDHPGLYADKDAECQVFHICQEGGREDSFLCPNGTVFNQQYFVCDWWYNFSCDHADRFYSLNAFIYELPDSEQTQNSYS